jgi:hypothetical protein
MTDHTTPRRTTRLLRTTFFGAVVLGSTLLASPAGATPPSTWQDPDNPSAAAALLTMGGWIFGIIAVIALLTYLPSMIRSSRGENALTFTEKSEWFGGPRTGIDQEAEEPQSTGGSSARW